MSKCRGRIKVRSKMARCTRDLLATRTFRDCATESTPSFRAEGSRGNYLKASTPGSLDCARDDGHSVSDREFPPHEILSCATNTNRIRHRLCRLASDHNNS